MELKNSPKIFENYKCDYPENTIKKIEEGFKSLGLEIVYHEKTVGSSDAVIYSGYALIDFLGFTQSGKGTTHMLSKASAYAEAAERFSTGFMSMRMPFPEKTSKYRKLLSDVTERKFLKGFIKEDEESTKIEYINTYFHEKINKNQYDLLKDKGSLKYLVDAYSLIKKRVVNVPIVFIEEKSTSNGLAAGNTIEEAISQASFEIFERYCANKIISEKIICPTIKNDTIKDDKIQSYLKMFNSLNIEVIIKDFSLGNRFPVIGVLFVNKNFANDKNKLKKDRYYQRIEIAAHCDLRDAVIRCFTEHLQNVSTDELLKRKETDVLYNYWVNILNKEYIGVDDEFKYFTRFYDYYDDLSFLKFGKELAFGSLNSVVNNDSLDDVEFVKNICIQNNWDMLIIDYTHKTINFPVARVIIPPISTDFDHFTKKCEKNSDFKERFNEFYGIKDFYFFIKENDWINDKTKIKKLIYNLESYLSKELPYFEIYLTRENNFQQYINILHILPFLYLSIDCKKEAYVYFKFLLELDLKPPYDSSFFNKIFLSVQNPEIYLKYMYLIEKAIEAGSNFYFELKSNPFHYDVLSDNLEGLYLNLIKNINDSYL